MTKRSITMIFLLAAVLTLCAGCRKTKDSEAMTACKTFFQAYYTLDGETAGDMIYDNDNEIVFSDMQSALTKHMKVKYNECKQDSEDLATVNVKITSADVAEVIQNIPTEIASQEEAKEYLITEFEKKKVPTKKFEVNIQMTKVEDTWYVNMTPELSDALLGGYNSMVDDMLKEAAE